MPIKAKVNGQEVVIRDIVTKVKGQVLSHLPLKMSINGVTVDFIIYGYDNAVKALINMTLE